MKRKMILAALVLACLGAVWGCGSAEEKSGGQTNAGAKESITDQEESFQEESFQKESFQEESFQNQAEVKNGQEETPEDANLLWDGVYLTGSVLEFSERGCILSPVHEDGNVAYGAAAGNEEDGEKVEAFYTEDCRFWIADIDSVTARADYEEVSLETVKKQTNLLLQGAWQEDGSFLADRVYIIRRSAEG